MLVEITQECIDECCGRGFQPVDPISVAFRTQQDQYHDFEFTDTDLYIWHNDNLYMHMLPDIAIEFLINWRDSKDELLKPFSFELLLPHEE